MQRIKLGMAATGTTGSGDTGYLNGAVAQAHWVPTTEDTGQTGTLSLALIPGSDTGTGFVFYTQTGINVGLPFGPIFPMKEVYDTGTAQDAVPIVGVGDKIRGDMVLGDTGMVAAGTLYVWVN